MILHACSHGICSQTSEQIVGLLPMTCMACRLQRKQPMLSVAARLQRKQPMMHMAVQLQPKPVGPVDFELQQETQRNGVAAVLAKKGSYASIGCIAAAPTRVH